jgi:hypothetical protein
VQCREDLLARPRRALRPRVPSEHLPVAADTQKARCDTPCYLTKGGNTRTYMVSNQSAFPELEREGGRFPFFHFDTIPPREKFPRLQCSPHTRNITPLLNQPHWSVQIGCLGGVAGTEISDPNFQMLPR